MPVPERERSRSLCGGAPAIAASSEALEDAGIDPAQLSVEERRGMGVVLGTGGGAIEFTERMYHLYYTNQTKKASI